jgi:hypothetical protein
MELPVMAVILPYDSNVYPVLFIYFTYFTEFSFSSLSFSAMHFFVDSLLLVTQIIKGKQLYYKCEVAKAKF